MPTKLVIISPTRIKGEHLDAGKTITLDETTSDGRQTIGELNAANRIVVHGSEGHQLWEKDQAVAKAVEEAKLAEAKKNAKKDKGGEGTEK